jgi:hypothetical protein
MLALQLQAGCSFFFTIAVLKVTIIIVVVTIVSVVIG